MSSYKFDVTNDDGQVLASFSDVTYAVMFVEAYFAHYYAEPRLGVAIVRTEVSND